MTLLYKFDRGAVRKATDEEVAEWLTREAALGRAYREARDECNRIKVAEAIRRANRSWLARLFDWITGAG